MYRVVFDTVIFVRSLINPHSVWGQLVFHNPDSYQLLISKPVVLEIVEVLKRPELTNKFSTLPSATLQTVMHLLEQGEAVTIDDIVAVSRDPNDDKFLATATAGNADYLVSEDNDLLVLKEHEGVKIITASAFLGILAEEKAA